MKDYHVDAKCGACGGPLEVTRDAICQACVPEAEFFRDGAAIEEAVQAGAWREIKQALRHARRQLMFSPQDRIAQHLVCALNIFEQCGVHFEETS